MRHTRHDQTGEKDVVEGTSLAIRIASDLAARGLAEQRLRRLGFPVGDGTPGAPFTLVVGHHLVSRAENPIAGDTALAIARDLSAGVTLRLETGRKPGLSLRSREWSLFAVPERGVWKLVKASPERTGGGGPVAHEWSLVTSGREAAPLPGWLFVSPLRLTTGRPLRSVDAAPSPTNWIKQEALQTSLRSLSDTFAVLDWERTTRPPRTWAVRLVPMEKRLDDPLRDAQYEVVSDNATSWKQEELQVKVGGVRCYIGPDPNDETRLVLRGPPGLDGAVTLVEDESDPYRQQHRLVDRMAKSRLSVEHLAAASTQVAARPMPPATPEPFSILPGESPWETGQAAAIGLALSGHRVTAIRGPPGTGKSTVIVGVVRRAVAQGQRVLLTAPTNVALDEVLRRLHALREGGLATDVYAARVAAKTAKVEPLLAQYLPQQLADVAAARAREALAAIDVPEGERSLQAEAARIGAELAERLPALESLVAKRQLEAAHKSALAQEQVCRAELAALQSEHEQVTSEEKRSRAAATRARPRSVLSSIVEFFTSTHEDLKRTAEKHAATLVRLEQLALEKQGNLDEFIATVTRLAAELGAAVIRSRSYETAAGRRAEPELKREIEGLERELDAVVVGMGRDGQRRALSARWREFISSEAGRTSLQRWAMQSVNLVAATTQGIATSPDFRDDHFDLVIVDEASRVTRAELLVPASRGARVVLVGDEHQLPPFVEPREEQTIHALAVLARTTAPTPQQLQAKAQALADEWNIDEPDVRPIRVNEIALLARDLADRGALPKPGVPYREMSNALTGSCFDHALGFLPPECTERLDVQRRMPDEIASLVRGPVYGGHYRSPETGTPRPLALSGFSRPWVLVDTGLRARADKAWKEILIKTGFGNKGEATQVAQILKRFISEVAPESVMVISFYLAQTRLLQSEIRQVLPQTKTRIEVVPIDRCQGQEADLVVISFVRSNPRPPVGYGLWLQDPRRLNVAFTRAKRNLVLVGSLEMLRGLRGNSAGEAILRELVTQADRDPTLVLKAFR